MVKDLWPGPDGSAPISLTAVNGTLYFMAIGAGEPNTWSQLWRSDGTEPGTVIVETLAPKDLSFRDLYELTDVAGTLCFVNADSSHGSEVWASDGTEVGTAMVKDLFHGKGSSSPIGLTSFDGSLFFSATTPSTGRELWSLRLGE